ncbi:MAG: hypothetical protein ACKOQW_07655 [Phycisphaerales bacterium]
MSRARGSVVVVVVWSVAIAAVMVAATQIVSYRQAVVGRESLARVEARWAARAGLEQMIALMEFHAAAPNPDDPLAVVRSREEMALGEVATGPWSISPFNDGVAWAGPRGEGAALDSNVATRAQLGRVEVAHRRAPIGTGPCAAAAARAPAGCLLAAGCSAPARRA